MTTYTEKQVHKLRQQLLTQHMKELSQAKEQSYRQGMARGRENLQEEIRKLLGMRKTDSDLFAIDDEWI